MLKLRALSLWQGSYPNEINAGDEIYRVFPTKEVQFIVCHRYLNNEREGIGQSLRR
jgi:hypothetical protein